MSGLKNLKSGGRTLPDSDAHHDHRLGFQTMDEELELGSLAVEGSIPEWLTGSLYRVGPAKFEAGQRSVKHWFDGFSMLHRFTIAGGKVSYANRFLDSKAYRAANERERSATRSSRPTPAGRSSDGSPRPFTRN